MPLSDKVDKNEKQKTKKKTERKYPWPIFAYYLSMTFGGLENTNLKKIVISDFDL